MNFLKSFLLCLLLTGTASAQNIIMKDGKVIAAKNLRRQGDMIMATVDLATGTTGQASGEFGYPIAQIDKIDFPEPPEIKSAGELIAAGKAADALTQLEPVVKYYEAFRDAPGSWWADVSLLKVQALISMGRDDEAEQMAGGIAATATDPATVRAARVYVARGIARHGDQAKAMEIYDSVLKDETRPQTIAAVAANVGQIHLARKEWEPALLSFLQVPVFYPQQKAVMPQVLLGCGKAYIGLEDFARAKVSLNELTASYSSTPEAVQGKTELEKIAKLEKTETP
jgi:hypothetical protein